MNYTSLENGASYTDPDQLPAALSLFEKPMSLLYADTKGIPTIGAVKNGARTGSGSLIQAVRLEVNLTL